jgi:virulence factor
MKRRIAIVGLGDIAEKVYLPLLSSHTSVEVVGIMNRTHSKAEAISGQYRIPGIYGSVSEMLTSEPDAVFIHSSTESHYAIAMECIQRGIHVFVDKPLSESLEEAEKMAVQAEKKGVLLAVGFNRRFAPFNKEAKTWLKQTGGWEWAIAQKHRTEVHPHPARRTLFEDLIHMIDTLVWLGDSETKLVSKQIRLDHGGRLLNASGILEQQRATGTFAMNRHAGEVLEKIELYGSGRSATVENLEQLKLVEKGKPAMIKHHDSWDTILHRRGFVEMVDHFLAGMDEPDKCTIRVDQVLITHRLTEQLLKEM